MTEDVSQPKAGVTIPGNGDQSLSQILRALPYVGCVVVQGLHNVSCDDEGELWGQGVSGCDEGPTGATVREGA